MKFTIALGCALLLAGAVFADKMNIQSIPLKDINGTDTSLQAYSGKVVLLVNVASKCGYTPQYEGLEALYEKYKDKGLVIVGVPSNDFGAQEPGTPEEIKTFCKSKYGVTFPLMAKAHVKIGAEQHPLYQALTGKEAALPGDVKWNFNKFLIGRDGTVVQRFESKVKPGSKELEASVEAALAKK